MSSINARIKETVLQVVVNFKKSIEYLSQLKQVFMNGSKSFQKKCKEVGLDLALVNELIKCNLGSGSSNRFTSVSSVKDDPEKASVEVE